MNDKTLLMVCAAVSLAGIVLAVTIPMRTEQRHNNPEPHNYIETPSGWTRVYKFVDDDGSKCYVAELQAGGAIALQCEIKP